MRLLIMADCAAASCGVRPRVVRPDGTVNSVDDLSHAGDGRNAAIDEVFQLPIMARGLFEAEHRGQLPEGADQSNGERPLVGRVASDRVAQSSGYLVGQAADQVFIVQPETGRGNDAEHPAPLHP